MKKKDNRIKRVWVRFTEREHTQLQKDASNYHSISEYIRARLFRNDREIVDPKEFIRSIDSVTVEMKRVGNNINQIARYINQTDRFASEELLSEIQNQLLKYAELQINLDNTWKNIIK